MIKAGISPGLPAGGSNKRSGVSASDLDGYGREWRAVEARFRRQPGLAVAQADELVRRLIGGQSYAAPSRAPWIDTLELGVLLGRGSRRDLKRVLAHYASIVERVVATGRSGRDA